MSHGKRSGANGVPASERVGGPAGRSPPVLFAERVAYLEGRVEEHSRSVDGVRDALVSLETRVDARFEAVDRRFDGVDRRIDALDQKVGRQFVWTVGIQVTLFVGLLAALLTK